MIITIELYKHRQQPFQMDYIDVITNSNLSDFDPELVNSINSVNMFELLHSFQKFCTDYRHEHDRQRNLTGPTQPHIKRKIFSRGTFSCGSHEISGYPRRNLTQRKLLKFCCSIFDPLAITMPLTLRRRKSCQFAWISQTNPSTWNLRRIPANRLTTASSSTTFACHGITSAQQRIFSTCNFKSSTTSWSLLSHQLPTKGSPQPISQWKCVSKIHQRKARVASLKSMTKPNVELRAPTR